MVPKTTQVIGWGAARNNATPHAALRDLAVTGPGTRPVRLQERSRGTWKTVRTLRTTHDQRLDLRFLARTPGKYRLEVRPWREWTGKTTSALRIQKRETIPTAPLRSDTKSASGIRPRRSKTPTAAFTATTTNLALAVDASGSTDPDGTITSYAWTWGDSTTGTGKTASHTYPAAGSYQVSLTVTDNNGAKNTTTKTVTATATAANVAPTAAFTSSTESLALAADASGSTDPDGTITSYAWTWGDSTTGTGKTASHTYPAAGSYQVSLTVTDNNGAKNTTTKTVTATAANGSFAGYGSSYNMDALANLIVGGPQNTSVSYRFRAERSDTLTAFRAYWLNQDYPNYGGGTGGTVRVSVQTDNGGVPSGTILTSTGDIVHPVSASRSTRFLRLPP